ncbi:MAG: outer membrane lipoprotein-sorting protein [Spirochaetales bacterium]|nr:outer membrane lipoprotein-sorting protein [Spirochaetales bacterium]MCF7937949.1 outer membrane lipoprotein-sorting protein [Spirochaetales bacterium]
MKNSNRIAIISALLILTVAMAVPAQETGLSVMEKVYNRPSGETMTADLVMTLTNSRGSTRERTIKQYKIETEDMEKKLMFFLAPADVRDTSFMSWSYNDGRPDDQWIYLPALRRVKRISSDKKDDSFMGSDFTYDDLGERHPSEDNHRILREETLKGENCYVTESIPVDSGDAFAKTVSWIAKDSWTGIKREYYNEAGEVYKTLTIGKTEKIDGYYVITSMTMEDHDRDHSTTILMENVSFDDANIDESFFSERQMQRGPRR